MLKIKKKRFDLNLLRNRNRSRRRPRLVAPMLVLVLFFTALTGVAVIKSIDGDTEQPDIASNAQSNDPPASVVEERQDEVANLFKDYDNDLYDKTTNTYSFSYNDYDSLFEGTDLADNGSGLKSGTYSRNGKTWNIYCYSNLNSCSVSTSTGTYGNVYCYEYTNSCSYSDSDGNYANTNCYDYLNSCTTTGSNGYSSNTHCYEYLNSCTTTDSNGGYSNTYCYEYLNSCTTNNSDGSTTNTYCYEYLNSCSSSTYGGTNNYGGYNYNYGY